MGKAYHLVPKWVSPGPKAFFGIIWSQRVTAGPDGKDLVPSVLLSRELDGRALVHAWERQWRGTYIKHIL